MSKRKISINMLASIISYFVSILISFVLSPYIIKTLGKELYSYFSIANNFVSYMSIISIALNSMASRFITVEEARGNHKEANCYFSSVFWGNIILIGVLSIVSFILVFKIEWLLNISESYVAAVKILLSLTFVAMFVKLISSVFSVSTYVKDKLYLNSIESIVHAIIRAVLLFGLYIYFAPSILYLGYSSLGLSILGLVYFIMVNRKIYPESSIRLSDCSTKYMRILISSGIWRSIDSLGGLLLFNTDLIIANIFISESAGGILSIVHTFPTMLQGILSAISSVFLPEETWMYGKGNIEGMVKRVKVSQKICGAVVSIPVCGLIIMGKQFFDLWVPGNNSALLQILSIFCTGYMPLFIVSWPVANLNAIMNRNRLPAIINVFGGLLNLSSMIILIKYANMGIMIVPLTSLIIQTVYNLMFIPIYPCVGLGISKWTFYPPIVKCAIESMVLCLAGYFIVGRKQITNWSIFFLVVIMVAGGIAVVNYFVWFTKEDRVRIAAILRHRLIK